MGRIVSAADYAAAALALITGVRTALSSGGKVSTARSYLAVTLCASAVALSLAAPVTLVVVARSIEIENVIRLAGPVFAMIGAWCAIAMVAYAAGSVRVATRRVRLAGAMMIVCVGVMVALPLAAQRPVTVELVTANTTNLAADVYEGLYVGYVCCGMAAVLWLVCRYARHGAHRNMRLSMCMYLIAGSTGLAWVGWQIATVVIISVAKRSFADQAGISDALASVAISARSYTDLVRRLLVIRIMDQRTMASWCCGRRS